VPIKNDLSKYLTNYLREDAVIITSRAFYKGFIKVQGKQPGDLTETKVFALQSCMTLEGHCNAYNWQMERLVEQQQSRHTSGGCTSGRQNNPFLLPDPDGDIEEVKEDDHSGSEDMDSPPKIEESGGRGYRGSSCTLPRDELEQSSSLTGDLY
jgi:hypothetical protein